MFHLTLVQGNCTDAPPGVESVGLTGPPFKWEAPQCVIICDHVAFGVFNYLWIDSLLMRATQDPVRDFEFITTYPGAWLFGTRLTFQGSSHHTLSALFMTVDDIIAPEKPRVYIDSAHIPVIGRFMLAHACGADRGFRNPQRGGMYGMAVVLTQLQHDQKVTSSRLNDNCLKCACTIDHSCQFLSGIGNWGYIGLH